MIMAAERGGSRHRFALLYTSATANGVYRSLERQVETIFFNGEPYMVESFTQGVTGPVHPASEFPSVLLKWNETSGDGKFAPVASDAAPISATPPRHRFLLSEQPIEAIWLRLRQLQSITLSKKLVLERAKREGVTFDDSVAQTKAEGIAYALRNATDYYNASNNRNVSQRILNLYYGSMSFAFAEMLARPSGAKTLNEIENSTKQGHGLYTVDGAEEGLGGLIVGALPSGFFPAWMKVLGLNLVSASAKPRKHQDVVALPPQGWLTVTKLLAHIPEISDLFTDIFDEKPCWVMPYYDQMANMNSALVKRGEKPSRSYIGLRDDSARLTKEDIAAFPGPIDEIVEVSVENAGRHFRAAVSHPGLNTWWDALDVHHSPFVRDALIMPIFGGVKEYRCLCVVLLYALSIIVRYRPSIWRRVQGGDLDHMRVLIEAFLSAAERILPEEFLGKVSDQRVLAKVTGSFF